MSRGVWAFNENGWKISAASRIQTLDLEKLRHTPFGLDVAFYTFYNYNPTKCYTFLPILKAQILTTSKLSSNYNSRCIIVLVYVATISSNTCIQGPTLTNSLVNNTTCLFKAEDLNTCTLTQIAHSFELFSNKPKRDCTQ